MNESGKNIYSENTEQQSTLGTVAYLSASGAENLGFGINIGSLSALRCRNQHCCRTGGAEGPGGQGPPIF